MITTLERAHTAMWSHHGDGNPLRLGHPLAHAYVLRMVAEFQAHVRDLHDLATFVLVSRSGAHLGYHDLLVEAATRGRGIDRGNADVRTVQSDFRRLGLEGMNAKVGAVEPRWQQGDQRTYRELIELRNSLAHGNETQLAELRARGILDTIAWSGLRLPALDRIAGAMDRVVWDHLLSETCDEPWR